MNRRRFRLFSAALAALSGVVVFVLASELFPYHTVNHDEAVYLQQAAMVLDGKLAIRPPVPDAFRPWFFVRDGSRLYPKYAPVPAATFAVGKLLGGFRLSLALLAAGNVALTAGVVAAAFDRRTGLLAGAVLLASPLFLVDSSVFLPYAPTTFFNLLFALAYFRSRRREHRGYALLAGLAIGTAFFARPYTAVLFAAPFVVHALYSLWVGLSFDSTSGDLAFDRLSNLSLTALAGLAGVAVTLGYNAAMTGSPLVFPYEAFAPHDGLGFGHREILGYSREYTPTLALRANAEVVSLFFTEWVVGGPVGTLLAAVGLGAFLRRVNLRPVDWSPKPSNRSPEFTDAQAKAILAGLFVSVIAGNVYFWGNLNVLGSLTRPDDGLVATLGPYYHFDLLLPTAAFAAHGALLGFDRVRELAAVRTEEPGRIATGLAVAGLVVLAGTTGVVLAPTVAENAAITEEYEQAYQPFEDRQFSNAVVFLPTPYGDWLAHPFQHLRNDPDFDGEVVYALDEGPDAIAVAAAYPNRTYYRYVYRGEWFPAHGESVNPALRRVREVRGNSVVLDATLGIPKSADRVSMRVSTGGGVAYYATNGTPENRNLSMRLLVDDATARLAGAGVRPVGENSTVPVGHQDEIVVQVFVSGASGGGFSFRLELPVRQVDGSVVALSPYREVCFVPRNCNGTAAYVEDSVSGDVRMETELRAKESVNATARRSPD